jgi:hypothetical protein
MLRRSFAILLLLVQASLNSSGQMYESVLGINSTTWNVFYEFPDFGANVKYSIVGDTEINSVNYKRLYDNWFGSYDHFLREDSTHSILYFYDSSLDTEYLMMDLNHEIGDTILYQHYLWADTVVVDSIYYLEGRRHLRTQTSMFQWPIEYARLEYIEGVGPTSEFLPSANSITHSGILLCHSRDTESTFIFSDTIYNCNYYWEGIKNISDVELDLFPNPAQSEVVADLNEPVESSAHYLITDISNKIRLRGKLSSGKNNIDISQLAEGSYFIRIFDEKKFIASKLFFKL